MFIKAGHWFGIRLALLLILTLGTLGGQPPGPVLAATLTVTNTNDSGAGSLRQAILDSVNGGTIMFNPALAVQPITLPSNLTINKDLTFDGSGLSPQVTISGGNVPHIVVQPFVLTISDLQ